MRSVWLSEMNTGLAEKRYGHLSSTSANNSGDPNSDANASRSAASSRLTQKHLLFIRSLALVEGIRAEVAGVCSVVSIRFVLKIFLSQVGLVSNRRGVAIRYSYRRYTTTYRPEKLLRRPSQTQCVRNHRYRAQAHRKGGNYWRQQLPGKRV